MSKLSKWLLGAFILGCLGVVGFVAYLLEQPLEPLLLPEEDSIELDDDPLRPVAVPTAPPALVPPSPQRARAVVQQLRSEWTASPAVREALAELERALASCEGCQIWEPKTFPGMTEALDRLIQAGAWNELPVFALLVDQAINASNTVEMSHSRAKLVELATRQYLQAAKDEDGKRCGAGAQRLTLVEPPPEGGPASIRTEDPAATAQALIWVGDLNADGLPELLTNDQALWSGCGGAAFKRFALPGSFTWFDHVGAEPGRRHKGWARLAGQVDANERETVHLFELDGGAFHHVGTRPWTDEDASQLWGKSLDIPRPSPTDAP